MAFAITRDVTAAVETLAGVSEVRVVLDVTGTPAVIDKMIIPPVAYGVKVVAMAMFTAANVPVVWRGPMPHRAVRQIVVVMTPALAAAEV